MAHNAKAGGERGANGEFYKGGQFVNTVKENDKRDAASRKRAAAYMKRRQQVGVSGDESLGYLAVYELPPSATARAIYGQLAGVCRSNRIDNTFGRIPDQYRAYVGAEGAARLDALREAYNRGARWFG